MRVLVVEDDPHIAADIAATLAAQGYLVEEVRDGEEAWFRGDTEDYAAVILDLGLPQIDGLSVLRRWRANARSMPVLILTARGSWPERVDGIDAGADDYLAKPFRMEELIARLRAIIRRAAGHASSLLAVGDLALDGRRMRVTVGGAPVELSALEYRLLSFLMHQRGRIVTQAELIEHVYAQDHPLDSNAIEVLIGRVRRKIGASRIETRRGFGYTMREGPP